ncbi:hypothetical protein [Amycolatopsis saalfeldensis]|uniref:Uncharacterized protein n=1 Tax=Amycolatopsis saalfeldensis TaxID=394193 RepID=A0A1H8YD40_9PSEU|nr:hypothetical protein [Amycolatopsis saalfeldensis]SEP49388.1 hypothetical protein SAMN04489732_11332 [Amycolatopsis saalfeldensis]
MNESEDELEQQLRALFADERLGIEPTAGVGPAIVAGAQRRRRRQRVMMASTGAVCALGIVAGGMTAFRLHAQGNTAQTAASQLTVSETPVLTSAPEAPSSTPAIDVPPPAAPPSDEIHASTGARKPPRPGAPTTADTPAKITSGSLLTADGLGGLKLGMTETQLADQGITLTNAKQSANCTYYDVRGAGVPAATALVSPSSGVVLVKPDGAAHTPEGVGSGSSKDDVLASYPGTSVQSGGLVAPVGGDGSYLFTLSDDGAVASVDLRSKSQDCAG